jgi:hypothetical protein
MGANHRLHTMRDLTRALLALIARILAAGPGLAQAVVIECGTVNQWEPAWLHVRVSATATEGATVEVPIIEAEVLENQVWRKVESLDKTDPRRQAVPSMPGPGPRPIGARVVAGGTSWFWRELYDPSLLAVPGRCRVRAFGHRVDAMRPFPTGTRLPAQPWCEFEVVGNAANAAVLDPALRDQGPIWKAYRDLVVMPLDVTCVARSDGSTGRLVWKGLLANAGQASVFEVLRGQALSPGLRARISLQEALDKMEDARVSPQPAAVQLRDGAIGILQGVAGVAGVHQATTAHANIILWGCLRESGRTSQASDLLSAIRASVEAQEIISQYPGLSPVMGR